MTFNGRKVYAMVRFKMSCIFSIPPVAGTNC